ncbi:hypothetical protein [Methylocaldum sp. RMAD-M]|uniref:hypothetical protein n=1 Tax=Methylocaldum sp. RMAD-M TaxID=2806557 RepID=UPI0012EBD270|nr:hypothetical protein [Methylocaldum sp. RMAD-M]MBP1151275.1 hypothetical protein [Methylocaldum sp. RMAD-M]MVF24157.1 hypothetical protein [Methylocaldum sp. BRCS4]
MMNKQFWKDFLFWLESAKVGEIFAARDEAREKARSSQCREIRSDLRRMIRLMDEELLTRSDLVRSVRRRANRGS